jgi:hypothetical protein
MVDQQEEQHRRQLEQIAERSSFANMIKAFGGKKGDKKSEDQPW